MIKSIQQFQEDGVKRLTNIFVDYSNDFSKQAEMINGVRDVVLKLGRDIIKEEWESYDELLRRRKDLRKGWHIVKEDEITRTTSLGDITYSRTLFINKETCVRSYLADELLGFEKRELITEDALSRIFEEAVESCYRKGGNNACIDEGYVTKQTVMNKIHALEFPKTIETVKEKKKVKELYIDADEDHVALQYFEKKGDIKKPRRNTVMPYIAYVYDGIDTEEDGRPKLMNIKYFGGIYDGPDGTKRIWDEVYKYIESAYDIDHIERIYINGDGAPWIKAGANRMAKARFVLDKYHMYEYIVAATSHLKDSKSDAISEIYRAIHKKKKWMAEAVFDKILMYTEEESKQKAVERSKNYILGNWSGIMLSMESKDKKIKCSAEGHVSHVYSDRMSSRPLGWSKVGADKMARLRIYWKNGGDMLELVRFQQRELPMAAGAEEVIYSAEQMIQMENANRRRLGNMADIPTYSIPYPQIRKIAAIRHHICGL